MKALPLLLLPIMLLVSCETKPYIPAYHPYLSDIWNDRKDLDEWGVKVYVQQESNPHELFLLDNNN